MKTILVAIVIFGAPALCANESIILPTVSVGFSTQPLGDAPVCHVAAAVEADRHYLAKLTITIGDRRFEIPSRALRGIEYPDLASLRIQVEKARDGASSYSVALRSTRSSEFPTWFGVEITGGKFTKVTKWWDVKKELSIDRHFETLHEEK